MSPIFQAILGQKDAEVVPVPVPVQRRLAPVTTPEDETELDTPTWERQVQVAKGVEKRLTEAQAPELYGIFSLLTARREHLLARKVELEQALALCKAELEALGPAWSTMSCCVLPPGVKDEVGMKKEDEQEVTP